MAKDQTLMWAGDVRPSGEIPAWAFYITQAEVVSQVRGALTKAMVEARNREMAKDT